MSYQHGISIQENTPVKTVKVATSGIQVVVGTAPIHLLSNPKAAVNTPIVAYNLDDVKKKIGYSYDFERFTLCESAYASFELMRVAPVVFINVLDPEKHKKEVKNKTLQITKGAAVIKAEGVLLNSISVKSGEKTYEKTKDYTVSLNADGHPTILIRATGTIPADVGSLTVDYEELDHTAVTEEDIIGGYDSATGVYSGAELIRQVHPRFALLPCQLLAPGWSHKPLIAAILQTKIEQINGHFNGQAILDIDSKEITRYEDAEAWKEEHHYNSKRAQVLWPKVKIGNKILWYSSVYAARVAKLDADNEDVPFNSPSNKDLPIAATVLADGKEVYLDQTQANALNAAGIITALNWNGWRTWGNNMAIYPNIINPQDQFISVRRMLDWWGNTFILAYFDKVDNPLDTRLIESVVDSENIRANGFQARGQIAGAAIEFREDMNPKEEILKGRIQFSQKIGLFGPAEHIANVLEFDPSIVTASIFGGE